MLLLQKLRRDLWGQLGSSIAVGIVMALGVMLFVSSAGAYRDLRDSYSATRARLGLAGLHVDVATPLTEPDVARIAALPGVAVAEARVVAEIPVAPPHGQMRRIALRVLSLPDGGASRLDRVLVLDGRAPGVGEVLLEKHFARYHGLGVGASLPVGPGGQPLRVSGVGVSAEYLWVARDENDFMPSAEEFGVGWMQRAELRRVAQTLTSSLRAPDLLAAASDAVGTQLLVEPSPGTAISTLGQAITATLGPARVLRATPSSELVGVKLLQMDVDGYQGMAAFFPFFFLGVGAFIMGSALARLVDAQRPLVGTLLALGVSRGAVLGHYLSYALVLGGGGALLGVLLGALVSPEVTRAYASELNIPFVVASFHSDLLLVGLAMGGAVSTVAGLLPAFRAMRLPPADAMRPAPPSLSKPARLLRSVPGPLSVQLALRDILDRPLRSLGTSLGVAAAVVLVLSTGLLMDSMRATFSSLFTRARAYDVRVDFGAPVPKAEALAVARGVHGVGAVEALLVVPARLEAGGAAVDVQLQALDDDARLVRAADADGALVPMEAGGLVMTRNAARKLHVRVGDTVQVAPLLGGMDIPLRLTGFADATMGSTASARRADVDERWALSGLATSVVARAPGDAASSVREGLVAAFPGALRVEDAAATRVQFDAIMGLGWVMIAVMLAFGGVLAGAILFNTATLLVLERQREFATLRALGLRMREVTALVTMQHGILVLLGLTLGLPLAMVGGRAILATFSGDLFSFPFVVEAGTVAGTLAGVFLVAILAQWPALRRVSRASLAEAVRVRA